MIQTPLFDPLTKMPAKPFLKWAGGKTQLLPQIKEQLPESFQREESAWTHCYFEPFMGSAALFFHLAHNLLPNKAIISDTNRELVLTFTAVRDYIDQLIEKLRVYDELHNRQFHGDELAQRSHYEAVRALDRQEDWGSEAFTDSAAMVEHAARFIYLNKTCFNGLWRVNKKGFYNVPMGRYKNPGICNEQVLRQAHDALQNIKICHQTYQNVVVRAKAGDLIYFDPPYIPVSQTSSFNAYAKKGFFEEEHRELAVIFLILASRNAHVILSNSDTPFTREPLGKREDSDEFASIVFPIVRRLGEYGNINVDELYDSYQKHWNVKTVFAKRSINSKAKKRGAITEILVSTD